jgi:hypothetical protein
MPSSEQVFSGYYEFKEKSDFFERKTHNGKALG